MFLGFSYFFTNWVADAEPKNMLITYGSVDWFADVCLREEDLGILYSI